MIVVMVVIVMVLVLLAEAARAEEKMTISLIYFVKVVTQLFSLML